VEKRRSWKDKLPDILKGKKGYVLMAMLPGIAVFLTTHEIVMRYFPDKTCVACHEMGDPIKRWKDSGTAKSHFNCASCHYEPGIEGVVELNKFAVKAFFRHWSRKDPNEPIRPPTEPLFLDEGKEPGYYSLVPNHRCFVCKDAKNHKEMDQRMIHSKLVADISSKPCKDCHNHDMRKGQKFYEKVLPKEKGKEEIVQISPSGDRG
jgi:trimethylamine-N-oxide reductase (cytochrome c) cytochrome c-type subunit TorY